MGRKWLRLLREHRPDLAAVADGMNVGAGWDMDAEAKRHAARKVSNIWMWTLLLLLPAWKVPD
jgi:hypothetical protein